MLRLELGSYGTMAGNFAGDAAFQAYRPVQLSGTPGAAGAGSASWALPIGEDLIFAGQEIRARVLVRDGGAPGGVARTPLLRATISQ
ncbi:MAG: hypothetical protein R3F17_06280 [Planctomycetota bacterium]